MHKGTNPFARRILQASAASDEVIGDNPALLPAGPLLCFGRFITISYIALALVLVVFFSSFMWFRGQREEVLALGPALLALSAAVGAALSCAGAALHGKRPHPHLFWVFLAVGSAALLAIQLFIVRGGLFYTDWDASILVTATVEGVGPHADYFSQYPNQLFLLGVFSAIAHLFTDMAYGNVYLALVVGGCICLAIATACIALVAHKIAGDRAGIAAFLLTAALVGLSPWMLVPYSDSYGILCPALGLATYTLVARRAPRMAGVSFFGIIGYFIKPTSIFILVAVVVVEVTRIFVKRGKETKGPARRVKPFAISVASVALGALLAFALNAAAASPYQSHLDQRRSLGLAHYLMIGSNYESNGRWTEEDYALSSSIDEPQERAAKNIEIWQERLTTLGPAGAVKLFLRKTLNNYLDGTFWWEGEGLFYREVVGESAAIKDFFNIGYEKNWIAGSTQNPTPYFTIAQAVWFATLLGCIAGALRRRPTNAECAAYASIFAVSIFLVVFECRARYLFLYAPYFTLLAVLGWQELGRRLVSAAKGRRCANGRHFK